MSVTPVLSARRIRILTAEGAPLPAVPNEARERFRQVMQAQRRQDESGRSPQGAAPGPDEPCPAAAVPPRLPAGDTPAGDVPAGDVPVDDIPVDTPCPAAGAPPTCTVATAPFLSSSPKPAADEGAELGSRIARALVREQRARLVIEHLAGRVAELCEAPPIVAGGVWEFRLDIDPAVLPDTSLLLRLGTSRLSLRFESRDEAARRLLRDHRRGLHDKLAAALGERYEIHIDAW